MSVINNNMNNFLAPLRDHSKALDSVLEEVYSRFWFYFLSLICSPLCIAQLFRNTALGITYLFFGFATIILGYLFTKDSRKPQHIDDGLKLALILGGVLFAAFFGKVLAGVSLVLAICALTSLIGIGEFVSRVLHRFKRGSEPSVSTLQYISIATAVLGIVAFLISSSEHLSIMWNTDAKELVPAVLPSIMDGRNPLLEFAQKLNNEANASVKSMIVGFLPYGAVLVTPYAFYSVALSLIDD